MDETIYLEYRNENFHLISSMCIYHKFPNKRFYADDDLR